MMGLAGWFAVVYVVAFFASAGYYSCKEQSETPKWWTIAFAPLVLVCWLVLVVFVDPIKMPKENNRKGTLQ